MEHGSQTHLEKRHREVYDLLPAGIDLDGGHDDVSLLVDELCHKPVPLPVLDAAPLAVLDADHVKVEAEVVGELVQEVDAEARAAAQHGRVELGGLLRDVDAHQGRRVDHVAEDALGGVAGARRAEHDVGVLLQEAGADEALLGKALGRFEGLSRPNDILRRIHNVRSTW